MPECLGCCREATLRTHCNPGAIDSCSTPTFETHHEGPPDRHLQGLLSGETVSRPVSWHSVKEKASSVFSRRTSSVRRPRGPESLATPYAGHKP